MAGGPGPRRPALALAGRRRRRTAHRQGLRRAAARRPSRDGQRAGGAGGPRAAPGAGAEGRTRAARPGLGPGARRRWPAADLDAIDRAGDLRGTRRPGPAGEPGPRPARSPSRPWSCCATTAPCRWPARRRIARDRPQRRRPRAPCSAATPSPSTSARSTRRPRSASSCRRCSRRWRAEFPDSEIVTAPGASVDGRRHRAASPRRSRAGPRARTCASLALGDRAGLFGRGTSGEGCDAESLRLPGVQQQLLDAAARHRHARSCVVLLAGRPYALGRAVDRGGRRSCRPSSPARRAPRRSPACSPAGSTRPAGCRSACPAGPAASRPPTWRPGSAQASEVVQHRPDAGLRLRPRPVLHRPSTGRTWTSRPATRGTDGEFAARLHRPQHRRARRAPRSCSSTCTTRSPRWSSRSSGWSATGGCALAPGEQARVADRPCRPTWPRSPDATGGASSSPATLELRLARLQHRHSG